MVVIDVIVIGVNVMLNFIIFIIVVAVNVNFLCKITIGETSFSLLIPYFIRTFKRRKRESANYYQYII